MPATVSSRSSISRKDVWQPEQPSSHTVAKRFLLMTSGFRHPASGSRLPGPRLFPECRYTWGKCLIVRSFVFFPHHGQVGQELPPLEHFGNRASLLKQGAGGTYMNALAATGAGFRRSP